MDIISFQKAKVAKKEIKEVEKRVGIKGTQQGLDIRGSEESLDKRILLIEEKAPQIDKLSKVSEVSAHTTANINRYNLKIASVLNQSKYHFKEMIIDSFKTNQGIDSSKSSNITHNTSIGYVSASNSSQPAILVTRPEKIKEITFFFVASVSHKVGHSTRQIDIESGSFSQTLYDEEEESIQLDTYEKNEIQYFFDEGYYITDKIKIGEQVTSIENINIATNTPGNSQVEVEAAYSHDGKEFTPFTSDLTTVANYIQLRFHLKAHFEDVLLETETEVLEGLSAKKREYYSLKGENEKPSLQRDIQDLEERGFSYDSNLGMTWEREFYGILYKMRGSHKKKKKNYVLIRKGLHQIEQVSKFRVYEHPNYGDLYEISLKEKEKIIPKELFIRSVEQLQGDFTLLAHQKNELERVYVTESKGEMRMSLKRVVPTSYLNKEAN